MVEDFHTFLKQMYAYLLVKLQKGATYYTYLKINL